jgi:hypothetical protein
MIRNNWNHSFTQGASKGRRHNSSEGIKLEDVRDLWRQNVYSQEVEETDRKKWTSEDKYEKEDSELSEWYQEGYQPPKGLSLVEIEDENIKEAHYAPAEFKLESPLEPGKPSHEFWRKNYDYTGENFLNKVKRKLNILKKELGKRDKKKAKEIDKILSSPNLQVSDFKE